MALKTSSNKNIIQNENYYTDETIIGTWTDGKPIYRKIVVNPTIDEWSFFYSGIVNMDTLIKVYGSCKMSNGIQPIPRVVSDDISGYGIGVGDIRPNGNILLQFGTKYSGQPTNIVLIFEYTKN